MTLDIVDLTLVEHHHIDGLVPGAGAGTVPAVLEPRARGPLLARALDARAAGGEVGSLAGETAALLCRGGEVHAWSGVRKLVSTY